MTPALVHKEADFQGAAHRACATLWHHKELPQGAHTSIETSCYSSLEIDYLGL